MDVPTHCGTEQAPLLLDQSVVPPKQHLSMTELLHPGPQH